MKTLSTSITFIWKFIFPTIWLAGFGAGAIGVIARSGTNGFPMLIGWVFGFVVMYFICFPAKRVMIDNNYIYINNFRKTIRVPLDQIKKVSENIMISPRPIFIEFKNETEFGKKIMFIGYNKMFLTFASHPAIKEINFSIQHYNERKSETKEDTTKKPS